MITALFILLVVAGGSVGDVFITKGMKEVGEISTVRINELLLIGKRVLTNKYFLTGIFFMAVSYFSFLAALARADLSLVLPATSISFVITTVGAKLFLKERVSPIRWAGILLVCIGVALISIPPQP
jgi:drug/metabolite transporter (DMT)-like permease